jgi:hypothetical protein
MGYSPNLSPAVKLVALSSMVVSLCDGRIIHQLYLEETPTSTMFGNPLFSLSWPPPLNFPPIKGVDNKCARAEIGGVPTTDKGRTARHAPFGNTTESQGADGELS